MGDKKLPGIAAQDIGKCAFGIFKAGKQYQGKSVGITGEKLTGKQMADSFSKVLGTEVVYNPVPPSVYWEFGFPGAEDLGNMFQFKCDFEEYFCGMRDVGFSKELNPELLSFEEWLMQNKEKISIQ
uniref:NmrA family NAD(P)-binding protein n=1 Tax=uncultured Draconibacterium sp. TaxID=1573823 RepID=UPI0032180D04